LAEVLTADISELLRPAGAYWSRRLMSVPAGQDVVAVNIDRADGGWNLIRTAEGWRIVAPQPGQANPDRIDAILDILRAPRAERIVALGEVPSTYREANDIITVLINTRSSDLDPQTADHHLTLVKTDEGTFAWTPDADVPAVGRIDEKLWDLLSGDLTTPPPSPEPPMPPGGGPMGPGGMMPIPPQ
jgi:hypothetical protein